MNFCPRCGHAFERQEVEGRMRPACPQCGYVAFLNPVLTVGVLATDAAGRLVLILRGEEPQRGLWGLPAGFMEADETAEEGARRECLEETGLTVELDGLFGVYSYRHARDHNAGVLLVYRARIVSGVPTPGTDSADVRLLTPSQIPFSQLAFSTHCQALRRWQAESEPSAPLRP